MRWSASAGACSARNRRLEARAPLCERFVQAACWHLHELSLICARTRFNAIKAQTVLSSYLSDQVIRMKKAQAKSTSILLAAPLLVFALTACSDNSGAEKKAAEVAPKPAAEAPATKPAEQTAAPAAAPAKPAAPAKAEVKVPDAQGSFDVAKLMAPGALPDKWLGDEKAPVTIIEYASMTCGHCANFHLNTLPEIKKAYIDTGKVRYTLREFPFDPRALAAFMLARCAGDNYYPLVDVMFKQANMWAAAPQDVAAQAMFQTVKIAGFSQESFDACLKDQQLLDNVNAVRNKAADEFKVDSTPTFFINGKKYAGALPFAEMAAIIDSMD